MQSEPEKESSFSARIFFGHQPFNISYFFLQLAKSILVTDDKSHGRLITLYEVVQIERLAENEQAAAEGVAHFQFGVFGLLDDEMESPVLDDPRTNEEFRSAWEHLHNDKYNEVAFRLYDAINAE